MKPRISLVGRAGFEPATNGLKARYALSARSLFPLCALCIDRIAGRFSPALCQILPTCHPSPEGLFRTVWAYNSATPRVVRPEASLPTPLSGGRAA
jgi:hypothetical protein